MAPSYARYTTLKFDRPADRVLRVAFGRPERRNAFTSALHWEISEIWRDIDRDDSVGAVLVHGEGRDFSVGGEFELVEAMIADPAQAARTMKEAQALVYNMVNCSKPIISSMQGNVVGGGLAIGVLADISIAANDAQLLDGHLRLGVAAGDHAVLIWPLLCGLAKAKYHLLLNEPISGERAEQMGLISLAVDAAELEDTALDVATRLAAGPPIATSATKYALNNWLRAAGAKDVNAGQGMQCDTSLLVFEIAATGGGIALGRSSMSRPILDSGRLVRPFDIALPLKEAFFLNAPEDGREHPDAVVFRDWLLEQAAIDPDNKMATHFGRQ